MRERPWRGIPSPFLHERRVAVIEAIEGEREQLLAGGGHRHAAVGCGAEDVGRATVMIAAASRSQLVFQGFRPFPMGSQQGGTGGVPPAEHKREMARVPVGSAGRIRHEEPGLRSRGQLGQVAGGRRRRIPHQQLLGPVGHGCEGPALRVVCDRRSRLVPGPSLLYVQPAGTRPYRPADCPLGTAGSPERQAGSGWLRVSLQSRARHLPRHTRRRHDGGLRRRAVVPAHPLSPRSRRPAVHEETVNESLAKALALFELTEPFTREDLDKKNRELLLTWHPHRYAMVTNNPRKYMAKYKQAEAMTKDIYAAYELLVSWLEMKDG